MSPTGFPRITEGNRVDPGKKELGDGEKAPVFGERFLSTDYLLIGKKGGIEP